MTANGWLQFVIYSIVLILTVRPVGIYLARVFEGERTWLDPLLRPIERLTYRLCGVNADHEMNWREYAFAMLGFSAISMLVTYGIERLQAVLPFNPQKLAAVGTDEFEIATPHADRLQLDRDGRGRIAGLTINPGSWPVRARRLPPGG